MKSSKSELTTSESETTRGERGHLNLAEIFFFKHSAVLVTYLWTGQKKFVIIKSTKTDKSAYY